jgi:hypothetical protein
MERGLVALQENRAAKWLADDRKSGTQTLEYDKWAKELWFPRAIRAGGKHWALVQPEKAVAKLNRERIRETMAEAGVNARLFADIEEPKTWLAEQ